MPAPATLGNRGSKTEKILNALDSNPADYSLGVLTPVGTARLNKFHGKERGYVSSRPHRPRRRIVSASVYVERLVPQVDAGRQSRPTCFHILRPQDISSGGRQSAIRGRRRGSHTPRADVTRKALPIAPQARELESAQATQAMDQSCDAQHPHSLELSDGPRILGGVPVRSAGHTAPT